MTAADRQHHRLKTTTSAEKSESIAPHVTTTASRTTTIGTATRRLAGVIGHELHPQTRSTVVAVATRRRTSTVLRAPTATEARSIVVATGLDLHVLVRSTRMMMPMLMEKRIQMAEALDESTGVAKRTGTASENANAHAIRSETARTAKTATGTTTMTARRIVPVIRTRTESGVVIVKPRTRSVTTMTTSTVRHVVAAKTETASETATMIASLVKRSPPIPTKKRTL
jgi:hypothetical protein